MSNKGLSKHTLKNYSKKKPKLPRYIKKSYEEFTLIPNRAIKHRKYDKRNGFKLLKKFLEKKVGCSWDNVYSQLKPKLVNYTNYLDWTIAQLIELNPIIKKEKVYKFRRKLAELSAGDLYVDNKGKIQQIPACPWEGRPPRYKQKLYSL